MDSRSSFLSRVFAKGRKKPSGSIDQGGIDGSSQWSEYPIISEHSETVEPDYHGESSQILFSSGSGTSYKFFVDKSRKQVVINSRQTLLDQ